MAAHILHDAGNILTLRWRRPPSTQLQLDRILAGGGKRGAIDTKGAAVRMRCAAVEKQSSAPDSPREQPDQHTAELSGDSNAVRASITGSGAEWDGAADACDLTSTRDSDGISLTQVCGSAAL